MRQQKLFRFPVLFSELTFVNPFDQIIYTRAFQSPYFKSYTTISHMPTHLLPTLLTSKSVNSEFHISTLQISLHEVGIARRPLPRYHPFPLALKTLPPRIFPKKPSLLPCMHHHSPSPLLVDLHTSHHLHPLDGSIDILEPYIYKAVATGADFLTLCLTRHHGCLCLSFHVLAISTPQQVQDPPEHSLQWHECCNTLSLPLAIN